MTLMANPACGTFKVLHLNPLAQIRDWTNNLTRQSNVYQTLVEKTTTYEQVS